MLSVADADGARPRDEERRRFRPYRRFLAVLVLIGSLGLSGLILRGIVNTLDRLPSAETMDRLEVVDVRALRACAEDLERLELQARKVAARALERDEPWAPHAEALETERLRVVARCRLDEPGSDPAINELTRAANALEGVLRTYALAFERVQTEGGPERDEMKAALRALQPLLEAD